MVESCPMSARPKVYVETTVISYLVARPSRDLQVAAHQVATAEWWSKRASHFDLFASELVFREAAAGDPDAAAQRLSVLERVPLLDLTESALTLAEQLLEDSAVPRAAPEDALHIAIAAANGMDFLVTWNCRHIANAATRNRIEQVCLEAGYDPPVICTPEELMQE